MNALLPGHTSEITAMSDENGKNSKNDLEFSLQMKKVMNVGSDIEVDLKIDNKSHEQRNVKKLFSFVSFVHPVVTKSLLVLIAKHLWISSTS